MEAITLEELKAALTHLPEEMQKELLDTSSEVDSVSIKMELVKFVTELLKHNQACEWETNKIKPAKIEVNEIIKGSQKLFDFLTE
tara:strand:+ start:60 stop:314 length:255 start_codon:yes stop_codon:yes gene_type:complete